MKILILKPSSLGDVIQALPVLRLLKRHRPDAQIWWWIDDRLAPLLEGDPDLAGTVRFHRRRWSSPRFWPEVVRSVLDLRAQRFDWVLDLQSLARSGLVAWLTNGRLLAGLDDAREGARGFYDVIVPRRTPLTHAVDWYLDVLRALHVPVDDGFEWIPARPHAARSLAARWPALPGPCIALQPGARWENKRWPTTHFATLARQLAAARPDLHFALMGGSDDRALTAEIAAAVPGRCVDLAGSTSLAEMVEALRRCELLVTNDTGPMHAAAALGRPVVGLFGPTEPRRTGPYRQQQDVLQRRDLPCVPCLRDRCHHSPPLECLQTLSADLVARAVLRRLPPAPGNA